MIYITTLCSMLTALSMLNLLLVYIKSQQKRYALAYAKTGRRRVQ